MIQNTTIHEDIIIRQIQQKDLFLASYSSIKQDVEALIEIIESLDNQLTEALQRLRY